MTLRASGSGEPASGRSLASDSIKTVGFRVLLYAGGFGIAVLISRGLGPEGRGAYYLPLVAAATLLTLSKLGLEQANVYLFANRAHAASRLSAQNGFVSLVVGTAAIPLFLSAPVVLPSIFGDTSWDLLLLAGLTIPLGLHSQLSAGLQNLQGQVTWQFRAGLAGVVLQLILLLALALLGLLTVRIALAATLAATLLTWTVILAGFDLRHYRWIAWDRSLLLESLGQSVILQLAMVFLFLHQRVDIFLVKGTLGLTAVGLYSLSVVLAETVLVLADSVALALLPRQVGNSLRDAAIVALRFARVNALLAIAVGICWVAAGGVIVRIFFGEEFQSAYPPLVLLIPGMVALAMQRVCGPVLLRAANPGRLAAINAVALAVNVILNLLLIPRFSIAGAAVSSAVSYGLSGFLSLLWTGRLAGELNPRAFIPQLSDALALWRVIVASVRAIRDGRLGVGN